MTPNKKTIVITGTHLTPALELIRQLQQDSSTNWQIHYIGRQSNSNNQKDISIESKIIPKLKVKFYSIKCGKLDRRYMPNTIAGIPKTFFGLIQSLKIIKKIKPNIVVSFGGYVSVPVIISSWINHIPCLTHEQTLTNSLTTKINSFFVNKVALSFDNQNQKKQLPSSKVVVTGNLLRYQIFNPPKKVSFSSKTKNKPIIYITAGNQGSHIINILIKKNISLFQHFFVIHQTGKNDFNVFQKIQKKYPFYFAQDYFSTSDFAWIINHADIFISRSGANTSQEIVALNKKSILIPLPQSQQNEQLLNAQWVKQQLPKKTIIINQDQLTSPKLLTAIQKLSQLKDNHQKSKQLPNPKLLNLINEIV